MAPTRPRLLLLDAGAVFGAFEHGAWAPLSSAYRLVVPSTVVRREAEFYILHETQERHELDLPSLVVAGSIDEFTASPADLAAALGRFREPFIGLIDAGEAEALAYLLGRQEEDSKLVTADGSAIEAVCMLGMSDRLLCLDGALKLCGHQKKLPWRHSEGFLKKHVEAGGRRLVTREGLR